ACATLARGEAGRTGDWRAERPVIDHSKCIPSRTNKESCYLCWLYCPEGTVKRAIPVEIDLAYCKGCGICAAECPSKAIRMEAEDVFFSIECPTPPSGAGAGKRARRASRKGSKAKGR
ncbi:MAG TPA: 4Fe-4S binding protein, partial [Syntrophobacteria bacterium]|nr:4Fe-4S binding protein [Syntrophobacteria bacterium]